MSTSKKHVCKKCKKKFTTESNLKQHLNRKTPCDKKKEYSCDKCKSSFTNKTDYTRHQNRKTSCVPEIKNTATTLDNEENKCKYCGNTYYNSANLKRHYTSCKVKKSPNVMEQKFNQILEKLEKQEQVNAQLQEKIDSLQPTINNITNNDNRQLNITLVNFGQEDLSYITPKFIAGLFDTHDADQILPTIIKKIHYDPEHPENHNIYQISRDDKHAMVYGPLPENPALLDWHPKPLDITEQHLTTKAKNLMFYDNGIPKQELVSVITDEGYDKVNIVINESVKVEEVLEAKD